MSVFKSKYFQRITFVKAPLFQQMSKDISNLKFLILEMSASVQFLTKYKSKLISGCNKEYKAFIRARGATAPETQTQVAT